MLFRSDPAQPLVLSGDARASLAGEMAFVTCRELAGGTTLVSTNIYVREFGDWHIAHHHSSHIVFPVE